MRETLRRMRGCVILNRVYSNHLFSIIYTFTLNLPHGKQPNPTLCSLSVVRPYSSTTSIPIACVSATLIHTTS